MVGTRTSMQVRDEVYLSLDNFMSRQRHRVWQTMEDKL